MKTLFLMSVLSLSLLSCADNSGDKAGAGTTSAGATRNDVSPDTATSQTTDTSIITGKGTDGIPSRTGAGQGNNTITGSATGSPTGTGKDSVK